MVVLNFAGKDRKLAIMNSASDGSPQISIYDLSGNSWTDFITLPTLNFATGMQCAKLVVGPVLDEVNNYSEPDLIVVAENGEFAIFRNKRSGQLEFEGQFYPKNSDVSKDFDNVTGAVFYEFIEINEGATTCSGNRGTE